MKKLLFLPICLCLSFCSSKKDSQSKTTIDTILSISSNCPAYGKCSVELLKNKSLDIKTDDIGSTYYEIIDNPTTSVIQYQYNKNVPRDLQDGQLMEQIIFQIDNNSKSATFKDLELQKTKMLFVRLCFCRGQTGYYKVVNGSLNINKSDETYTIDLKFKMEQVPQLYTTVNVSVK